MNQEDGAKRLAMEELSQPERFTDQPRTDVAFWQRALDFSLGKIRANLPLFRRKFPGPAGLHNRYPLIDNTEWTSSFWTGLLWLSYEASGELLFRKEAEKQLSSYRERLDKRIKTDTHDLGFLYTLSCVAAWKLTGNQEARDAALKAADLLMTRYFEKAGIIQAWGDLGDKAQRGRIIVDCAMNLPLLRWAASETGNPYYADAARKHLDQMNRHAIRPDWSTYHTFYFDAESGAPLRGVTAQGYADSSCWARGQAWAIYGNALAAQVTQDSSALESARGLARYFLNRLPKDFVPYWDLVFVDGKEERDSSAAAIAVCGLLELAKVLPAADPERRVFENAAFKMLESLARFYTSADVLSSNAILLHAVYNKPSGEGVDECVIWGDYFYMEALVRLLLRWRTYW